MTDAIDDAEGDDMDGMTMTPVLQIEPSLNWVYDQGVGKWINTETGEVRASSPSECGEDDGGDYPQVQIVEEDTFFLTPQQIRAGIRLDIDESGQIRACPRCGKRQVVIENRVAGQQRTCADVLSEPATCGYKARI